MQDSEHKEEEKSSSASKKKEYKEVATLEELIRQNNGQDVSLQFYFEGKLIENGTCYFDIWKQSQNPTGLPKKLKKKKENIKFNKNDPAGYFMKMMNRNQENSGEVTIYFRIQDKKSEQLERKDSLVDFLNTRARTRSQADNTLNDNQNIDMFVQQIIENEFQVFKDEKKSPDIITDIMVKQEQEKLELSLKILKIIYFISKNTGLFEKNGLASLLGASSLDKDLPDMSIANEQLKGLG